jgi:hypothetical protein
MRRLLLGCTAATALSVNIAYAGGMAEPVMEPAVVEAQTSSSAGGLIVPLLLLLVIAAAVSGGGGSSAPTQAISDRRIKKDIRWVGLSADSLPIYRYRYHGMSTQFEGVMAQDVLHRKPEAVSLGANGVYAVDYSKLSAELRVVA